MRYIQQERADNPGVGRCMITYSMRYIQLAYYALNVNDGCMITYSMRYIQQLPRRRCRWLGV